MLYIEQTFLDKASSGQYGRVVTKLSGRVPAIRQGSPVKIKPFKQQYTRENAGKLESTATVKYTVDGQEKMFKLEQAIFHDELRGCASLDSSELSADVFISSFESNRYEKRKVLGIALYAKITNGTSGNGDGDGKCGLMKVNDVYLVLLKASFTLHQKAFRASSDSLQCKQEQFLLHKNLFDI